MENNSPETIIILAERNFFDYTHFQIFHMAELRSHIDIVTSDWGHELIQKSLGDTIRTLKV